jgi:hypothetical protein
VFFAAFDGTNNSADPSLAGDTQTTAVQSLAAQVQQSSNVKVGYFPGPGTPGTVFLSAAWDQAATAQAKISAQDAYEEFGELASNWLLTPGHSTSSITTMITGFSRGCAAAAIFAQMLYQDGLVYKGQVIIAPGTVGAVSTALMLDPVLTGELVNTDFPPGIKNLTIVQAANEYRTNFEAANYNLPTQEATVISAPGAHSDIGDSYGNASDPTDNNLGGIYLGAYTSFFQNAGLSVANEPASRQYDPNASTVIHSEGLISPPAFPVSGWWDGTYNTNSITTQTAAYLNVSRMSNAYGTTPATATPTGGTTFTAFDGTIVLNGQGASSSTSGNTTTGYQDYVVLPNATAQITGNTDDITVDENATLTFNSTSEIGNSGTVQGLVNVVDLGDDATLNLNGWDTAITGDEDTINISGGNGYTTLNGTNDDITLGVGATIATAAGSTLSDDTITVDVTGGAPITFDAGTFTNATQITNPGDGNLEITLSTNVSLGTLSIDTANNTDSFTLANGAAISLPGIGALADTVSAAPSSDTPEQVLLAYLSDLGDPTSASALDTLNFDYLNPAGTAETLSGTANANAGNTSATVTFVPTAPSETMTGVSTATIVVNGANESVPVTQNIVDASLGENLAQDTITRMNELLVDGYVTLTNAEFTEFGTIAAVDGESAELTAANGGTYNLNASNVAAGAFNGDMTATGWDGTTLIGNSDNDSTLTASLFGNDTLEAGSGTGDTLVAGLGVDTLEGGTGGDTFMATGGLAAGSTVTGGGTGNTLDSSGDLSGVTISGIQSLVTGFNDVTLTASQFSGFTSITTGGSPTAFGSTISAATGGTYDLANVTTEGYNLTALANSGTTLIGNGYEGETLTASATGNDTLHAGNGEQDTLVAGGGVDTLIGGTGSEGSFVATNGLAAGSAVEGNTSGDYSLEASGNISGATITNVQGFGFDGGDEVTMTGSQFNTFNGSIGSSDDGATDTINITTAGTYNLDFTGTSFDLAALSNSGTTMEENGITGAEVTGVTLTASASGNDTLSSSYSTEVDLDASDTSGNDTLYTAFGTDNDLDAEDSTGTLSLTGTGGSGNILDATGSTGTATLNAAGDSSDSLFAGNGSDTLYDSTSGTTYGGGGTDTIYVNSLDTVIGGSGNDTFVVNAPLLATTSISGGSGTNILTVNGDALEAYGNDISQATITDVPTLYDDALLLGLTASQLASFTTLQNATGTTVAESIAADTAGTYSLAAETVTGSFNLIAAPGTFNVTLVGNNQNNQYITGGAGTDTLQAGSGTGDVLIGGTGTTTFVIGGTGSVAQDSLASPSISFVSGMEKLVFGDPITVEVQEGKSATIVGSNGTMTVNNDASGGVIQNTINWTAGGSEEQELSTTSSGSLSAEYDQSYSGANGTGTQLWADSIVPQSNGSINVDISGTGEVFAMSGVNVATANGTSATFTGNNNSVGLGNNNTVTLGSGTNADSTFGGSDDTVTLNGTNDSFIAYGNSNIINLTGTGDTAVDASPSTGSNSFSLTGNSEGVSLAENGDTGTLSGTSDTATLYASGESLTVSGTSDTVTDSGTGSNTISITGTSITAYISNASDVTTVGGSHNTAYLFDNNTTLTLNGTYNTGVAYGSDDTINVNGSNDMGNDYGTSGDQVIVEGSGDNAIITKNGDSSTIAGSHNTAEIVGTDDAISVSGNDNTLNDYVTTGGNSFSVTGSGNSVGTYNSDTITFSSPASSDFAAFGGSCTINDGGTDDSFVAYGNGNTVNLTGTGGSADDASPSTGSNSFVLGGSSNTANLTMSGDTATVTGSHDTVGANTGDTITLTSAASYGYDWMESGETVSDAGTSDHTVLYASGDTVTVTGTGDLVTDAGSGSNTITLNGSSNTADISNTTSDTLTVGGSSNTVDVLNGVTGTETATINGTSDVLKFAGATSDAIVFGGSAINELILSSASSFAGTVAGMGSNDSIDLANFQYSGAPTVSSVTGTGATGSYTDVTITDGSAHVMLALLNQYTAQYAVSSSAYTLTADGTGGSAGTLFELAAGH